MGLSDAQVIPVHGCLETDMGQRTKNETTKKIFTVPDPGLEGILQGIFRNSLSTFLIDQSVFDTSSLRFSLAIPLLIPEGLGEFHLHSTQRRESLL
jgi:hypothetical protein